VEFSVYKNTYNNCCQLTFSLSEYTKINVGWGFAPNPTGGAYSTSSDPSWFQGDRFVAGGEWRGKGEWGTEGKREKLWNSALVVGGIDAPELTQPVHLFFLAI